MAGKVGAADDLHGAEAQARAETLQAGLLRIGAETPLAGGTHDDAVSTVCAEA